MVQQEYSPCPADAHLEAAVAASRRSGASMFSADLQSVHLYCIHMPAGVFLPDDQADDGLYGWAAVDLCVYCLPPTRGATEEEPWALARCDVVIAAR
jgi:hypothetical protein